ncbi:MAG: hypothetical protein ACLSB9_33330 [Hydrogeniiclostridium mannosilyticum]
MVCLEKKRLVFSMFACLALVLGLAACSVRTPVTAEAFKGAAEELGFTVEDKRAPQRGQGVRTYYVCTNSGTNQVLPGFASKEDSIAFIIPLRRESPATTRLCRRW